MGPANPTSIALVSPAPAARTSRYNLDPDELNQTNSIIFRRNQNFVPRISYPFCTRIGDYEA